jgi:two-component system response regulator CpxR
MEGFHPARILIIDDDAELGALLRTFLAEEGWESENAHAAAEGLRSAADGKYDLILLDVTMPEMDGFEVLGKIRSRSRTPVLMLTARGDTLDRVRGLELGADDYLPKPFDPPELAARIRAILRRVQPSTTSGSTRIAVADIELDVESRTVWRDSRIVELTMVEFDLLLLLLRSAGESVARERLALDVLHRTLSPFDRSLDTHVYNLRKKLGTLPDGRERIRSIRGEGYIYTAAPIPLAGH